MVYIFGLAVVFIVVILFWTARAIINAIRNYHRRHQPSLPPPITQPSLSSTAESVLARFMASTMDDMDPAPAQPPPARRRSSVYSGVVRAHDECASDPELPRYTSSPTASRPELIIIEDEDIPPPLTPLDSRTTSPVSNSFGFNEAAPGYTTRPATPRLMNESQADPVEPQMASVGQPVSIAPSSPIPIPHVTFANPEGMPARPPTARRKHNQRRGGRVAEVAFIATV